MHGVVLDTLACPFTGTFFTCAVVNRKKQIIIWYNAEFKFNMGDKIENKKSEWFVNHILRNVTVYHVSVFNSNLWARIKMNAGCPKNNRRDVIICDYPGSCIFKKCPFDISKETVAIPTY